MKEASEIAQLLCINTCFAHLTRSDPYLARQIKDAVDRSLSDSSCPVNKLAYEKALTRLARTFGFSPEATSFAWIDTEQDHGCRDPLWLRETVMFHLKKLARHPHGTLLIANLSTVIRPEGKRWTIRRRKAYAEMIGWLRDLVRARTIPERPVDLLFL
jgi:hypothetical protein